LTLDCNGDSEKMNRMKSEQRERKKREGDHIIYRQGSRSGSISSSDESELDEVEEAYQNEQASPREKNALSQYAKDRKQLEQAKWGKIKRNYGLEKRDRGDEGAETVGGPEASAGGSRLG
jgi:hypothetical protein